MPPKPLGWYFKDVSMKFQNSFKEVSMLFQKSFKSVSRKCQECFKEVSGKFQGCFKNVSRVFQEVEGHFHGYKGGLRKKFKMFVKEV